MKKVFDYHTGKLVESIDLSKKERAPRSARRPAKLYESAFDDILDSRELHNEKEVANILSNGSSSPIMFWYYPGNAIANTVQDICDANGLTCAFVDSREIMTTNIQGINDVDVIIINELTRCPKPVFDELYNDILDKVDEGIAVVGLCRIDAAYNELYANDLFNCDNYIYSPQYDRQSHFVDPEYDDEPTDEAYESVTEKFARYRKLYEGDDEEGGNDAFADLFGDTAPAEDGGDGGDGEKPSDEEGGDEEPKTDDEEGGEEETEDVPMTAIIITVAKDDAEKCKDEMVEAGIPEDGIEILDGEEDDENAKLRVDADHALELKDYLKGKGIDLEEKIGGEIVDDSEEGDDDEKKEDEEGDDEDKDKDKKDEEGGGDDDFDAEFGDLFGDEGEGE